MSPLVYQMSRVGQDHPWLRTAALEASEHLVREQYVMLFCRTDLFITAFLLHVEYLLFICSRFR